MYEILPKSQSNDYNMCNIKEKSLKRKQSTLAYVEADSEGQAG